MIDSDTVDYTEYTILKDIVSIKIDEQAYFQVQQPEVCTGLFEKHIL